MNECLNGALGHETRASSTGRRGGVLRFLGLAGGEVERQLSQRFETLSGPLDDGSHASHLRRPGILAEDREHREQTVPSGADVGDEEYLPGAGNPAGDPLAGCETAPAESIRGGPDRGREHQLPMASSRKSRDPAEVMDSADFLLTRCEISGTLRQNCTRQK